jgi:hypothetical protein
VGTYILLLHLYDGFPAMCANADFGFLLLVTSVTYSDVKSQSVVGSSKYTASWSITYAEPTATANRW